MTPEEPPGLPFELVYRCVLAMTPEKVCRECGEPSRRIVEQTPEYAEWRRSRSLPNIDPTAQQIARMEGSGVTTSLDQRNDKGSRGLKWIDAGWTDCGHNNWRQGRVWYYTDNGDDEMTAKYLVADVFDGLATLEDGSVDLVVTSPPFLALRSYLPADDPLKAKEIGSEPTPAAFLDVMLAFTAELRRVLAPHGSICIELGDTYAGGPGESKRFVGDQTRPTDDRKRGFRKQPSDGYAGGGPGWPLAKSKTLIPELFRIALAYGINPLTGQPSPAGQWRVRNVVTWARPNPPVGALGDKWRPATSDVVVACVSGKRYWDDLATRKTTNDSHATSRASLNRSGIGYHTGDDTDSAKPISDTSTGAPLLDYWEIPLDGGEPTRYGPKEKPAKVNNDKRMYTDPIARNDGGEGVARYTSNHESGAPLLDYWVIPLDPDEEPTRYGPKEKVPPEVKQRKPTYDDPATRPKQGEPLSGGMFGGIEANNPGGSPLLDYWVIPPGGYTGSHYAVFPPELVVPLVKAMCPEKVCRECGEPSRRIVESERLINGKPTTEQPRRPGRVGHTWDLPAENDPETAILGYGRTYGSRLETTGWTDCGHNNWRPGLVLDPFAGSGTTLLVATGHGHDAIGIDIDKRNAELALERVGPFMLTVEELETTSD